MSEWSGKTKGGVFGYNFFIILIKNTNRRIPYLFLRAVALYFLFFSQNKSIKFYFKKIHRYKGLKLFRNIYKNYVLLGEILIDKIAFMVKEKNKFTFDYDGENYLRQMAANNKGGMLIGAHMGNWEIAGNLLERIDTKINIVLVDAEHHRIKELLEKNKVIRKFNIITIKDDFSHLHKIKQAFNNDEFVVIHGDRYVEGSATITADFMGKPAKFATGPLYMASKNKVPVSFVFTMKEKGFHYHFYASKPKVYDYPANLKTRKNDMENTVKEYVSVLEKMVKKYPTQWFNYFPFWEEEKI